jgi:hypothetical protein
MTVAAGLVEAVSSPQKLWLLCHPKLRLILTKVVDGALLVHFHPTREDLTCAFRKLKGTYWCQILVSLLLLARVLPLAQDILR